MYREAAIVPAPEEPKHKKIKFGDYPEDDYYRWENANGTLGGWVSKSAKIYLGENGKKPYISEDSVVHAKCEIGVDVKINGNTSVGPRTKVGTKGGNVELTTVDIKGSGRLRSSEIEGDITIRNSTLGENVKLHTESNGKIVLDFSNLGKNCNLRASHTGQILLEKVDTGKDCKFKTEGKQITIKEGRIGNDCSLDAKDGLIDITNSALQQESSLQVNDGRLILNNTRRGCYKLTVEKGAYLKLQNVTLPSYYDSDYRTLNILTKGSPLEGKCGAHVLIMGKQDYLSYHHRKDFHTYSEGAVVVLHPNGMSARGSFDWHRFVPIVDEQVHGSVDPERVFIAEDFAVEVNRPATLEDRKDFAKLAGIPLEDDEPAAPALPKAAPAPALPGPAANVSSTSAEVEVLKARVAQLEREKDTAEAAQANAEIAAVAAEERAGAAEKHVDLFRRQAHRAGAIPGQSRALDRLRRTRNRGKE